ncbi:MAG TPA: 4a-hydroxytetrahydrobiopterin dehydratase [Candidatus Avipropionibacterium avicola]|uniref:Putative pterin-4-alpha-carbinolamine dehydratase n=1 Tax=Candidatus Avipropionibacterium avicola TaxID=2840701 RepID=A0A9D1GYJ5_9ACTN|nr:4a-hydroxytetrahydrobiopterin dehydratase [Candidatus Avipropionibacterium avicola]
MPRPLDHDEIAHQIAEHQRWSVEDTLVGRFECDGFATAIQLVNAVAAEAEEMNHHPDIDIRFDTVVLNLLTHSEDGITQLDIELAMRADQAYERLMAGKGNGD